MHFEPFLCVRLMRTDEVAHALHEDLSAAAVERCEPGVAQSSEAIFVRTARAFAHVVDLGSGEQGDSRWLNAPAHFLDHRNPEMEPRLLGVVSADDMELVVV